MWVTNDVLARMPRYIPKTVNGGVLIPHSSETGVKLPACGQLREIRVGIKTLAMASTYAQQTLVNGTDRC
jgi:hypothetical protein